MIGGAVVIVCSFRSFRVKRKTYGDWFPTLVRTLHIANVD